jgi:RNA polymerase sigma-70 factor, ECF subfamily
LRLYLKQFGSVEKPEQENDILLFQKVSRGDFKSLETLFNLYYKRLCQFTFLFVREKDIAEELSADVFVKIWQKRNQLKVDTSLRSYLYTAAKNASLSYLKSRKEGHFAIGKEELIITDQEDNPEENLLYQEFEQHVEACIAILPPQCRLIFRLHRFDEMKYKEIAVVLNISVKTVEIQMSKALKLLNESIKV